MKVEVRIFEIEMLKEKFESLKSHIDHHKVAYAIGATMMLTAATSFVMFRSNIVREELNNNASFVIF